MCPSISFSGTDLPYHEYQRLQSATGEIATVEVPNKREKSTEQVVSPTPEPQPSEM